MHHIIEDAALLYRQELESMSMIVAPGVALAPVVAIVAALGSTAMLAAVLTLVLMCSVLYLACVSAAALIFSNNAPGPGDAYRRALDRAPALLGVGLPGLLLAVATASAVLLMARASEPVFALSMAILGGLAVFVWSARHAYDAPLMLLHDLDGSDALRASPQVGGGLFDMMRLLAVVASPLALAALLAFGLGVAVALPVGVAVFAMAAALWLPFAALAVTVACNGSFESRAAARLARL